MLQKAFCWAAVLGLLLSPLVSGFGLTVSGTSWIVDTSGGLVFTVNSANGDVISMEFNGQQAQDPTKFSQISSGLGSATCSNTVTGTGNDFIKITCVTPTLTQYYVAQNGVPAIHMGTFTTAEPTVGELRFISRLNRATLPNGNPNSDVNGGTAIEGSDVFLVDGITRSKFYSSVQFINDQVHGATGNDIGAFMIIPGTGYEASSGGPFFRDIDNQGTAQQEVYFYMNSGHTQTEDFRQGFHGPYALWFTTGAAPGVFDTSFWATLDVEGFVPTANRGFVIGKAIDIPTTFNDFITVGWENADAQYWAKADPTTQDFSSPAMIPGTYTMNLFKRELIVGTQTVTVTEGATVSSNIHDTFALETMTPIWQIGDFDGTPTGFLNADLIQTMHPSDSRMHSWGPVTFTVGENIGSFPMAIFQAIGPATIEFTLEAGQNGARTLMIAVSLAFAGGRPQVMVNNFAGPIPPVPDEPDSRGVTRGTWRGNNQLYAVDIPTGVLTTGSAVNTITITVASGSSGADFLSPNIVIDAVALF